MLTERTLVKTCTYLSHAIQSQIPDKMAVYPYYPFKIIGDFKNVILLRVQINESVDIVALYVVRQLHMSLYCTLYY